LKRTSPSPAPTRGKGRPQQAPNSDRQAEFDPRVVFGHYLRSLLLGQRGTQPPESKRPPEKTLAVRHGGHCRKSERNPPFQRREPDCRSGNNVAGQREVERRGFQPPTREGDNPPGAEVINGTFASSTGCDSSPRCHSIHVVTEA